MKRMSWLVIALLAMVWINCVVTTLTWVDPGGAACSAAGEDNFGTATRSWFPVGYTCTYDGGPDRPDVVVEPSHADDQVNTASLFAIVAIPVGIAIWRRRRPADSYPPSAYLAPAPIPRP